MTRSYKTSDEGLADLGKAIAFGVGVGLGAVGAGIGIGNIFGSMIQAVARQPELRGELTASSGSGSRSPRPSSSSAPRRPARLRARLMSALASLLVFAQEEEEGGNALMNVVPGLMIWTIVTFAIVLFILKRLAFGRIQGLIDQAPGADP